MGKPQLSEIAVRILLKLGMLRYLNCSACIGVNGKQVHVPIILGLGLENLDRHEQWMSELLRGLMPLCAGGFLDIGVNLGQTLITVKTLDPSRPYLGVEPNPACVFYLDALIQRNHFQNCDIVPSAVSSGFSIVGLTLNEASPVDASASIVENFRNNAVGRKRWVVTCPYAELSRAIQFEPGIVKIDVEGAEWEVLQSLKPLLAKRRPFLLVEILPVYTNENRTRLQRQRAVEDILRSLGYELFRIFKNEHLGLLGVNRMPEIEVHSDLSLCDYLAVPNSARLPNGLKVLS